MGALYDRIGIDYHRLRRPDPRLAAQIAAGLGDARSVLNVGAGAGSYEPRDRRVLAIEPALTMIRQRPADAAPVIRASATALPLRDASVDAATAFLTLHHWADRAAGLAELRRVAKRRVVLFTWLSSFARALWVNEHYFPEVIAMDAGRFPTVEQLEGELGPVAVRVIPVPHDCTDGFYGAWWRRPEAFLDPKVRAGISVLQQLDPPVLARGLAALARDLDSGAWAARHRHLAALDELDLGYRLIVWERPEREASVTGGC